MKVSDYEIVDYGIGVECDAAVDYPDYAAHLAADISNGKIELGIAICGTGIGMSMVANKFRGVRASLVTDSYSARMSKQHNNANVLCLGARTINHHRAMDLAKLWLESEFEGGRHEQRLQKMDAIEKKNFVLR